MRYLDSGSRCATIRCLEGLWIVAASLPVDGSLGDPLYAKYHAPIAFACADILGSGPPDGSRVGSTSGKGQGPDRNAEQFSVVGGPTAGRRHARARAGSAHAPPNQWTERNTRRLDRDSRNGEPITDRHQW